MPPGDLFVDSVITLDASGSNDPDGDELDYLWRILSRPLDSIAVLGDPIAMTTEFTADQPGAYELQLAVYDGTLVVSSFETLSVVIPPPTVEITTPEDDEIFDYGTTSVQATGFVDDPNAAVTVNGKIATNEAGSWSTFVDVAEGENPIEVVATNSNGEGTAEVTVLVSPENAPTIVILSHKDGFIEGPTLSGPPLRDSVTGEITEQKQTSVVVTGLVKVKTLGAPSVWVNGQPSNVRLDQFRLGSGCIFGLITGQSRCYSFDTTLTVDLQESLVIDVEAIDALAIRARKEVSGYVDYCIIKSSDGPAYFQADAGGRQNNRCHEIDGCSLYTGTDDLITQFFRNDPAKALASFTAGGQNRKMHSTEFGSGEAPPEEFYIHGNAPQRRLPCNRHDQCYQTAGSSQAACDYNVMNIGTYNVCRVAYPRYCPYSGLDIVFCADWALEKHQCYRAARIYYWGDVLIGAGAHAERQEQYTHAGTP